MKTFCLKKSKRDITMITQQKKKKSKITLAQFFFFFFFFFLAKNLFLYVKILMS